MMLHFDMCVHGIEQFRCDDVQDLRRRIREQRVQNRTNHKLIAALQGNNHSEWGCITFPRSVTLPVKAWDAPLVSSCSSSPYQKF